MGESKGKLESERVNRNPEDILETAHSYLSLHLKLTTQESVCKASICDLIAL